MKQNIDVGFQTFVSDGGEEFGAARAVAPGGRRRLVIYVENAGDFVVRSILESVHSENVILNCAKRDDRLRRAVRRANETEKPGF